MIEKDKECEDKCNINKSLLHICDPCRTEHNLPDEEGYHSIRPCDTCIRFKQDTSFKETAFVRTTLSKIEMNITRRELGFVELGD